MSQSPILVTGAAGRVGGVGGEVVEILRSKGHPVRALVGRMMIGPRRCGRRGPRSSSATSLGPTMSREPWKAAVACTSA